LEKFEKMDEENDEFALGLDYFLPLELISSAAVPYFFQGDAMGGW